MPTYEELVALLAVTDPAAVVELILRKAHSGEGLQAAWGLLEELVEQSARPPVLRSVDSLVEEPILANAFKRFLRERFCVEMWDFWCDAKAFRATFSSCGESARFAYVSVFFALLALGDSQEK